MKKILTFALAVSMMASLAASASALEYSIDAPNDYDFGKDTSIEVNHITVSLIRRRFCFCWAERTEKHMNRQSL